MQRWLRESSRVGLQLSLLVVIFSGALVFLSNQIETAGFGSEVTNPCSIHCYELTKKARLLQLNMEILTQCKHSQSIANDI